MKQGEAGSKAYCRLNQYSDQMLCTRCGMAFDVNDPNPPACGYARQPTYPTPSPWVMFAAFVGAICCGCLLCLGAIYAAVMLGAL